MDPTPTPKKTKTTQRSDPTFLRGWQCLSADLNWADYHGMWARPDPRRRGGWFVLHWWNILDAAGERGCAEMGLGKYECAVKYVDLEELHRRIDPHVGGGRTLAEEALDYCGFSYAPEGIVSPSGDVVAGASSSLEVAWVVVDAATACGFAAPLAQFFGNTHPHRVRARGKAEALRLSHHPKALEAAFARPVNQIGTSARNYGLGQLMTYDRPRDRRSRVPRERLDGCPYRLRIASHYRDDGSCRCDDILHRHYLRLERLLPQEGPYPAYRTTPQRPR